MRAEKIYGLATWSLICGGLPILAELGEEVAPAGGGLGKGLCLAAAVEAWGGRERERKDEGSGGWGSMEWLFQGACPCGCPPTPRWLPSPAALTDG
jgi:hypothetical protein